MERIKAGIIAAWEQRESDMPGWIPAAGALTFKGLARLLNIQE
jgi:hypothetical protein